MDVLSVDFLLCSPFARLPFDRRVFGSTTITEQINRSNLAGLFGHPTATNPPVSNVPVQQLLGGLQVSGEKTRVVLTLLLDSRPNGGEHETRGRTARSDRAARPPLLPRRRLVFPAKTPRMSVLPAAFCECKSTCSLASPRLLFFRSNSRLMRGFQAHLLDKTMPFGGLSANPLLGGSNAPPVKIPQMRAQPLPASTVAGFYHQQVGLRKFR